MTRFSCRKRTRTLPELQKKLHFKGSDEKFKKYVTSALLNRGPIYREIFQLYYGINCKKYDIHKICYMFPGCDVPNIRKLVMNRLEHEISEMIASESSNK